MQTVFLLYWNWFVIHCDGLYSYESVNKLEVCFIWILQEAEAKQLWLDYFKHMVPQVQMSNFNGTHLTKICCEYLSYNLTPSEYAWCKSLCSLQHHQILRSTHPNYTTISLSTWHFSSDKNANAVLQTQFLQLVKYTNNKNNTIRKYTSPLKLYCIFHSN